MRLALVIVFVLSTAAAQAQTVEAVINLHALGWGPLSAQPVETDGDLQTTEWLVSRLFSTERRVVAERHGTICAGPWFDPAQGGGAFVPVVVQRFGLVHKLLVQGPHGLVKIGLDTPVCESDH